MLFCLKKTLMQVFSKTFVISLIFISCIGGTQNFFCVEGVAYADNEFEYEEDEFGYEEEDDSFFGIDDSEISEVRHDKRVDETSFQFKGFILQNAQYSYNLDSPYLSMFKTTINLSLEKKVNNIIKIKGGGNFFFDSAYRLKGRDSFTKETLDELEYEAELRDTYIELKLLPSLYFTTGRQVNAWGKSDFFRLNDRINSRDQRQLGVVELQEARFPVFSSGLSYSPADYSLVFQVLHEANNDKIAPNGSEFDYYKSDSILVDEPVEPDVSFTDNSYFLKLTRFFNGGEISIYTADGYENLPYLEFSSIDISSGRVLFVPQYKQTYSAGISGNFVKENTVFKYETIYTWDNAVQRKDIIEQLISSPMRVPVAWEENDTIKTMFGVDYSGIHDLTVTVEGFSESIINYENNLLSDKHSRMIYLLALYETLNSTLDYSMLAIYRLKQNDSVVKLKVAYNIIDALTIDAGVVIYMASETDSQYYPYRNNDMIFSGIKYSF